MKTKSFLILTILFTILTFTSDTFAQATRQWQRWHLPEGATMRLGKGRVGDIEYSPDGTRLAVSSTVGIWLYDAQTGEELDLLTGQRGIILWDADTRQHLRTATHILEIIDPVGDNIVALSPDGKTVASAAGWHPGDRGPYTIRLWEVDTGHLIRTFELTPHPIRSLEFSPDGKTLVSIVGYENRNIILWDVDTGSQRSTIQARDHFYSVTFSPDGKKNRKWTFTSRHFYTDQGTPDPHDHRAYGNCP